jgi:16S rRNA (adenine1518-N6/adenine1519-N6)-dimethyltransferase
MIEDPRRVLARHGLRAKKSWGQNFLVDRRVHQAIVAAAALVPDDWVVEIGAGLGTLTAHLAEAVPEGRVIAVERDRDMAAVLRIELAGRPLVEIAEENALHLDYASLAARAARPLVVVGNLPYQIASPLLFRVLEARPHVRRCVLMLQKEMAERILAGPGTKAYGALGVMVRTYAEARSIIRARAGAFHPPPKVDSKVLLLDPLAAPRVADSIAARYAQVVHAAFEQRRKTLKNALSARWESAVVDQALAHGGIDGRRRGETLTIEEFTRLAEALHDQLGGDHA